MSNGFPSMTALLGLLAVAGYQNRDKLAEMLGSAGAGSAPSGAGHVGGTAPQGGLGGLLGSLAGAFGGAGAGSAVSGGIGELVDRFKQNGHGEAAESWVRQGPNQPIAPHQLEQAIGPDVLANLTQKTGLSRDELLSRLARDLPRAVDDHTPDGRLAM
jgi:uncharacterized protein YidB (DUF937 family)